MKTLPLFTPVVTTFYSKENVFGFVKEKPKSTTYVEDGKTISETHYILELVDGDTLRVEDVNIVEVNPENMPENYELSLSEQNKLEKENKMDNEFVNLSVEFFNTDTEERELKDFSGLRKDVKLEISKHSELKNYNSYSTTTK